MLFFADSGERAKTQALLIGSVVSVVAATLLLLSFLDNPYYGGVGALKPVAMKRTEALLAKERALLGSDHARSRAMRPVTRGDRRPSPQLRRDRRDRAAVACRRRNGLERLPGDALERRAGEGVGPDERDQGRGGARPGALRVADAGRRRDVHPVGRRLRARPDGAVGLLLQALPQGVPARCQRLARDQAAQEPECPADPVRDAAVQARCGGRGEAAGRRSRALLRRGSPRTSSVGRTTSSASSSSRCRSSSRD